MAIPSDIRPSGRYAENGMIRPWKRRPWTSVLSLIHGCQNGRLTVRSWGRASRALPGHFDGVRRRRRAVWWVPWVALTLDERGTLKWVLALRMSTALWRRTVTTGELGDLAETGSSKTRTAYSRFSSDVTVAPSIRIGPRISRSPIEIIANRADGAGAYSWPSAKASASSKGRVRSSRYGYNGSMQS